MSASVRHLVLGGDQGGDPTTAFVLTGRVNDSVVSNMRHLSRTQVGLLQTHNGGDTPIPSTTVNRMLQLAVRQRANIVRDNADRLTSKRAACSSTLLSRGAAAPGPFAGGTRARRGTRTNTTRNNGVPTPRSRAPGRAVSKRLDPSPKANTQVTPRRRRPSRSPGPSPTTRTHRGPHRVQGRSHRIPFHPSPRVRAASSPQHSRARAHRVPHP